MTEERFCPKMRRRYRRKLFLAPLGVVLAFLFGEIAVRMFPGTFGFLPAPEYYMPHVFVPDKDISWTLEPNATSRHDHIAGDFSVLVTTDRHGFRANPFKTGNRGLMILGDSFTFGFGVENHESFPGVLARRMPDWNVFNAGYTGGMALDTQFVYLREHYHELQPRVVVFQFFSGNDFDDMAANIWIKGTNGLPTAVLSSYRCDGSRQLRYRRAGKLGTLTAWIRRHSCLGACLMDRVAPLLPRRARSEGVHAGVNRSVALVDALLDHSKAHGYKLAFMFVPNTFDGSTRNTLEVNEEVLRSHLKARNIPFLALDDFWNQDMVELHFAHDGHWRPYGHVLAAKRLHDWLTKSGLL